MKPSYPLMTAALAGLLANAGCTQLIDVDLQTCDEDSPCRGDSICSEDGICVGALCSSDQECKDELDTDDAVCAAGVCEDPIWGCIGRKDPREPEGDRASFKLELVDAIDTTKHPMNVEAKACPKIDTSCANALNIDSRYNNSNGILTVEGLPQDFNGVLRFTGSQGGTDYMPGRFFFETRTVVNDYVATEPSVALFAASLPSLGMSAGVEDADADRGLLLGRVFDCQGELAEGVTLVVNDPGLADDAVIFYTDESNAPTQDLAATTSAGTIGIANILKETNNPDRTIDMEAYIGNRKITELSVIVEPATLTHVYIYPGYE